MSELKYKVGDKVRIKSLDWYNENKDEYGEVNCYPYTFFAIMTHYCGTIRTINSVDNFNKKYKMTEDGCYFDWTDEMIEGLVDSIEDRIKELRKMCTISLTDSNYTDKVEVLLNDYEYIEENGKAYFVKKKKEYPKTYEECLSVLGIYNGLPDVEIYNAKPSECTLFESLIRLKRCRDAYWKIAGEEKGLGKPWEPDWNDEKQDKHGFYNEVKYTIINPATLVFPTAKMRDAFYEAFKEDIEKCKELL